MLTYPKSFHQGFNLGKLFSVLFLLPRVFLPFSRFTAGFNCAEAVNFATEQCVVCGQLVRNVFTLFVSAAAGLTLGGLRGCVNAALITCTSTWISC